MISNTDEGASGIRWLRDSIAPESKIVSLVMSNIASLAQNAFDPESIHILETAFDTAWKTVKSSGSDLAVEGRAASTRELLARRIIAMAECGERDPRRLVDDALAHLATSKAR